MAVFNAANFWLCTVNDTTPFTGNYANSTFTTTRLNTFLCPSSTPPGYTQVGLSYTAKLAGEQLLQLVRLEPRIQGRRAGGPPNGSFYYVYTPGKRLHSGEYPDSRSGET